MQLQLLAILLDAEEIELLVKVAFELRNKQQGRTVHEKLQVQTLQALHGDYELLTWKLYKTRKYKAEQVCHSSATGNT